MRNPGLRCLPAPQPEGCGSPRHEGEGEVPRPVEETKAALVLGQSKRKYNPSCPGFLGYAHRIFPERGGGIMTRAGVWFGLTGLALLGLTLAGCLGGGCVPLPKPPEPCEEIIRWVLQHPTQDAESAVVAYEVPTEGRLRFTLLNPDQSRDGPFHARILTPEPRAFVVPTCRCSSTVDLHYPPCEGAAGVLMSTIELAVSPGPVTFYLHYFVRAQQDKTGPDTFVVCFVPEPISPPQSSMMGTFTVDPQEQKSATFVIPGPGQVIVDVTNPGTSGNGWFGLYMNGIAVSTTQMRDTFPQHPQATPHKVVIPRDAPGAWEFKIAHEDSLWGDNEGVRSADIYFVPTP